MPKTLIALVFAAASAGAQPVTYGLGPDPGAPLRLEVEKTGLLSGKKHVFEVQRFSGTLFYDPAHAAAAKIELRIEANGLVLKDDWLKASDFKKVQEFALGDEMLAARQHPILRFESSSVGGGPGNFAVKGTLSIRGISKPAEVAVRQIDATHYEIESTIRLKDFNLKPPSAVLGAIGTKNEMRLSGRVAAAPR